MQYREIISEATSDMTPQQKFLANAPVVDGVQAVWGTSYWNEPEGQAQPDEVVLQRFEATTRGQGAGSHLLRKACALADQLGVTIWAQMVPLERAENTVAGRQRLLAFYRRFGFELYDLTIGDEDEARRAMNDPREWPQIVRRPKA